MSPETEQVHPYSLVIETATGQSTKVPFVFLTDEQVKSFLQLDFNRLVQEAGVRGARIHLERAVTADYEAVLGDVAACLRTTSKAA